MTSEEYFQTIPWSERPSIYPELMANRERMLEGDTYWELTNRETYSALRAPFPEMVQRTDLFAAIVDPIIPDLSGSVELAPIVVNLLKEILRSPTLEKTVQFYQLIITDYRWNFDTWGKMDQLARDAGIFDDPEAWQYFVWLIEDAPDECPVRFALGMLQEFSRTLPEEMISLLALHMNFIGWVCPMLASRFDDAEDRLISLARIHQSHGRIHALRALKKVERPANRQWLLSEGYRNNVLNIYTAGLAAVLGDLIGRLRSPALELTELIQLADILDELTFLASPPRCMTLLTYSDGPEACRLLLDHCTRHPLDERLFWPAAFITDFTEDEPTEEEDSVLWPPEVREYIVRRGHAYLSQPGWPKELKARWIKTFRKNPNVQWLEEGDLDRFSQVVDAGASTGDLTPVCDWAVQYLYLDRSQEDQAERRKELEAQTMPGWRSGGITAMTDEKLGSIYGQILLQILQAMVKVPGGGWEILRAGLLSGLPFHAETAGEVLSKWPKEALAAMLEAEEDKVVRKALESAISS